MDTRDYSIGSSNFVVEKSSPPWPFVARHERLRMHLHKGDPIENTKRCFLQYSYKLSHGSSAWCFVESRMLHVAWTSSCVVDPHDVSWWRELRAYTCKHCYCNIFVTITPFFYSYQHLYRTVFFCLASFEHSSLLCRPAVTSGLVEANFGTLTVAWCAFYLSWLHVSLRLTYSIIIRYLFTLFLLPVFWWLCIPPTESCVKLRENHHATLYSCP